MESVSSAACLRSTRTVSSRRALRRGGQPGLAQRRCHRVGRGLLPEEIVYAQCVLADIEDYANVNAWWRRQFPDVSTAPARLTFQAGALPFGAKIEIQAVATRGG